MKGSQLHELLSRGQEKLDVPGYVSYCQRHCSNTLFMIYVAKKSHLMECLLFSQVVTYLNPFLTKMYLDNICKSSHCKDSRHKMGRCTATWSNIFFNQCVSLQFFQSWFSDHVGVLPKMGMTTRPTEILCFSKNAFVLLVYC